MANILFGGPDRHDHGEFINDHDPLIMQLRKQNYRVDYTNDAPYFIYLINDARSKKQKLDLVLYDCRLMYPCTGISYPEKRAEKRIELFKGRVLNFLKSAKTGVFVLADPQISSGIEAWVNDAGMFHFNMPYDPSKLSRKINSFLLTGDFPK